MTIVTPKKGETIAYTWTLASIERIKRSFQVNRMLLKTVGTAGQPKNNFNNEKF